MSPTDQGNGFDITARSNGLDRRRRTQKIVAALAILSAAAAVAMLGLVLASVLIKGLSQLDVSILHQACGAVRGERRHRRRPARQRHHRRHVGRVRRPGRDSRRDLHRGVRGTEGGVVLPRHARHPQRRPSDHRRHLHLRPARRRPRSERHLRRAVSRNPHGSARRTCDPGGARARSSTPAGGEPRAGRAALAHRLQHRAADGDRGHPHRSRDRRRPRCGRDGPAALHVVDHPNSISADIHNALPSLPVGSSRCPSPPRRTTRRPPGPPHSY